MSSRRVRVVATETGVRIIRKKSRISGWGVYAAEPINKNKRILQYTGEKISSVEADRRETRYQKNGQIWCFTLNRRWFRDGNVGGSMARFINHSCTGNCYSEVIDDVVWIRASKNIAQGAELSYDYNTGGEAGLRCRCRPGCKNKL